MSRFSSSPQKQTTFGQRLNLVSFPYRTSKVADQQRFSFRSADCIIQCQPHKRGIILSDICKEPKGLQHNQIVFAGITLRQETKPLAVCHCHGNLLKISGVSREAGSPHAAPRPIVSYEDNDLWQTSSTDKSKW